MKKILCFGDSNTYGYIPGGLGRFSETERWSGILQQILGCGYEILEQGMNNRNGFFENPENIKLCGVKYLPLYLKNHIDIDICILALGTNDLQFFYNLDKNSASKGIQSLINIVKKANKNTKIIIIPPVKIRENIISGIFSTQFDIHSVEKIKEVFPVFKQKALKNNCFYLDLNEYVTPSEVDGLHYSKDSHKIIAEVVSEFICSKVGRK